MAEKARRNNYKEGLTRMTVNGVNLVLVSRAAKNRYGERIFPSLKYMGSGQYLHTGGFNRDKLYKAAGYDTDKIDFAVPQPWLEQKQNWDRFYGGDRAVWSYEGKRNKFGGRPIWDSEAWKKLKAIVQRRLSVRKK